jgi:hypothetical protein
MVGPVKASALMRTKAKLLRNVHDALSLVRDGETVELARPAGFLALG